MVPGPRRAGGGKNMSAISAIFVAMILGSGPAADPGAGDRELRELTRALGGEDPPARIQAAISLGTLGPRALPALPHLLEALLTDDEEVRLHVAGALGKLGPGAVPTLITVLGEIGDEWLAGVVSPLVEIAEGSPEAVRLLTDSLSGADDPHHRGVVR